MQLLDFIFLLLRLLCISEKQPGGSCLSLRAADHRTMILRDKANIRNASDAYVDSISAETVSICALLYKLLAAVAPEGGEGSDSDGGGRRPVATAQRDAAAVAPGN